MQIRTPSRLQPSAEAHQLLPRSTQNTSIAELPIQRSGFIMDQWSCAISFQAVILWLLLFTLQKGSQDLLSYTTRRGATGGLRHSSSPCKTVHPERLLTNPRHSGEKAWGKNEMSWLDAVALDVAWRGSTEGPWQGLGGWAINGILLTVSGHVRRAT
jgi:hypothetical protein